jgi:transcriptional regulator with XRE-family HTH domain
MKDALTATLEYLSHSMAQEIRDRRKTAHLTQAKVAKRARVTVETISRMESGKANPTIDTLLRVLHAIGALGA